MLRRFRIGILLLFLLAPTGVKATFIDGLGLGARPMALGSAYTAVADDVLATYYNPAGLAQMEKHSLLLGYLWSNPVLEESSVSDPSFQAQKVIPYRLNTPVIGLGLNPDDLFKGHMPVHTKAGVLMILPDNLKSIYRAWDVNSSVPRWIRFGDYWDRIHVLGGLSIQPDKAQWISCGIGFRFIVSSRAYILEKYGIPGLNLEAEISGIPNISAQADGNINMDVDTNIACTAGLMLTPIENLRIGYSFRDSLSLIVDPMLAAVEASVLLDGQQVLPITVPLGLSLTFEAYFFPREHNFGISYILAEKMLLSLELSWFQWSQYTSQSRGTPKQEWKDIYIPRVGIEYYPFDAFSLRLGYFFEPSPVPDQTMSSNFLDNDRHVLSIGAGYTFNAPFDLLHHPMDFDLVFQYIHLPKRETTKQAGYFLNAVTEDYETEGEIISIGGNITIHF